MISICIPTYKRPDLLRDALDSCLAQTYREFEIIIGDDSPDTATEELVREYQKRHPELISYVRNTPGLGQNGNVNSLFARARGSRLVLLHDDDTLLPNALKDLAACWDACPSLDAAFGKQYLMDQRGNLLAAGSSDALNKT